MTTLAIRKSNVDKVDVNSSDTPESLIRMLWFHNGDLSQLVSKKTKDILLNLIIELAAGDLVKYAFIKTKCKLTKSGFDTRYNKVLLLHKTAVP